MQAVRQCLVINLLVGAIIMYLVLVIVIHVTGAPSMAVRVAVTLVTVPLAAAFICWWIYLRVYGRIYQRLCRRRHVYYELRSIGIPPVIQSTWDGLGEAAEFLDDFTAFGAVSRRMVIACIGSIAWFTLGLVPPPIGFIVLLAMLCMAFPRWGS